MVRSFEGMPVVTLYSFVIALRRLGGIGSWVLSDEFLEDALCSRTIRSQWVLARGSLSRIVGWITM